MIEIATILRYDTRPVALARLYADNVVRRRALRFIAACLLLGPASRDFGFEQIEVDRCPGPRDDACHRMLYGDAWWGRITIWARERRGPLKRCAE